MQYTWQLALVLVPVYFIKHSVSCYIYYIHVRVPCIYRLYHNYYWFSLFVWYRVLSTLGPLPRTSVPRPCSLAPLTPSFVTLSIVYWIWWTHPSHRPLHHRTLSSCFVPPSWDDPLLASPPFSRDWNKVCIMCVRYTEFFIGGQLEL